MKNLLHNINCAGWGGGQTSDPGVSGIEKKIKIFRHFIRECETWKGRAGDSEGEAWKIKQSTERTEGEKSDSLIQLGAYMYSR